MADTKGRARPAKGTPPRRNGGLESVKRKLPFPARLACFWPLAVVPGLAVYLLLNQAAAGVATAFVLNSLFTIWFYKTDKLLAEQQLWRIPESSLHFWELFCGWPGALYAQGRFHHKWKKLSYMVVFWLYVILNVLGVCWLLWPGTMNSLASEAAGWLRSLLNG